MEKIITISDKNFSMKSSAITQFKYKDETGRSLIKDLTRLLEYKDIKKIEKIDIQKQVDILDEIEELLFKISYVMIKEYDSSHNSTQVIDYEDFLSNIDGLDDKCYIPILELACNPLSRQLQKNK